MHRILSKKKQHVFQSTFRRAAGSTTVLWLCWSFYHRGEISIENIVKKMCHNPAILFRVRERGFIREGYYADLTLVDLE